TRHVRLHRCDPGLRIYEGLRLHLRAREERQTVHDDERTDEIGMIDGKGEGQRATEAVADDDGMTEMVRLNVRRELSTRGGEHRLGDRWNAREPRERDDVTGELLLIMRDRRLPGVAGRRVTGNQDHRTAVARHLNTKGLRRGLRAKRG